MESIRKLTSVLHSAARPLIFKWSECVRRRLLLICLLNAVTSCCALGITVATKYLIDGAVSADQSAIWKYGWILGGLIVFESLVCVFLALVESSSSARLQKYLQSMVVRELLVKDYSSLKGYHSGELVNRFFSDVAVVRNGIMNVLPQSVSITVSFIGASVILIIMDWRFVILLIIGAVFSQLVFFVLREPMKRRHMRKQEAEGKLHALAQESLANIRLIKSSLSEKRSLRRIGIRQDALESEQLRQGRFSAMMNNGIGLVFDLSWFICMLGGCIGIAKGRLTYGSLAAIIQLIGRIQGPIAQSVSIASETFSLVSSAERLKELTDLPEEEQGEKLESFDTIEIRDVTFRYDDGIEDVLQNVSCTIRRGDFVALTGISGGGKSSLFQLLLGIYRPTKGEVVFRSGEYEEHACRGTRELFAYVPQGNTLLSGTLRENFTMFTDASDEEIMEVCKIVCIDDLVEEIGLDVKLGERGIGLSEGQAQRVAIGRALLTEAPILLLDESTSALDEGTEARLLENISQMRKKTCFIVTHRMTALEICDYCLHLEGCSITRETIEEAKMRNQEDE